MWGGYILSNMPGPNLESIFHRQQKYICVALLHFSKVLKEGGGGSLAGLFNQQCYTFGTLKTFLLYSTKSKKSYGMSNR